MHPSPFTIQPVHHASTSITWGDHVLYADPVGDPAGYTQTPDIVLITDIHSDHLDTATLEAVSHSAPLIVPQAVKDVLPPDLSSRATVLANGVSISEQGFTITAVPMYNMPESVQSYHPKGRGNGYLIEKDGTRLYIAGDTAGTPEMRALRNIDAALVPMNLPYTMSIEEAASAVLDFAPRAVYPYHYRGSEGIADVQRFKALVNAENPNINVVLLNWYPH